MLNFILVHSALCMVLFDLSHSHMGFKWCLSDIPIAFQALKDIFSLSLGAMYFAGVGAFWQAEWDIILSPHSHRGIDNVCFIRNLQVRCIKI